MAPQILSSALLDFLEETTVGEHAAYLEATNGYNDDRPQTQIPPSKTDICC